MPEPIGHGLACECDACWPEGDWLPGSIGAAEWHQFRRRMADSLRGDLGWTNDALIERVSNQMARVAWSLALVWITERGAQVNRSDQEGTTRSAPLNPPVHPITDEDRRRNSMGGV